ncbi:MAG: hypothetical protein Kow0059_05340 [Candidatus Sumerlaeia bacterium]
MKHRTMIFIAAMAALVLAASAPAAIQYNGNNIYVTGSAGFLDGYNPGSNPALQLKDDGLDGDAVADDGVYSRTVLVPLDSVSSGTFEWKVAASGWLFECPGAFANSRFSFADFSSLPVSVTFYFNSNAQADDFRPDPNAGDCGIVFSYPNSLLSTNRVYRPTGDWMDEAGIGGDWDPANNSVIMTDPDSDGVYTVAVTGIAPGNYEFKVTIDGGWDNHFSVDRGVSNGGANGSFQVLSATDTITFSVDVDPTADLLAARISAKNDNPQVNPGPPFFATSSAWGTALDSTTQLLDDGTQGDCVAGDGIYSRSFTVSTPGQYGVRVQQFVGPSYPDSSDYPINVSSANQTVTVFFDTNTYPDTNYQPNTRFVYVDVNSLRSQSRVQAVGDWQFEFGAPGDWNPSLAAHELADDGVAPDTVPGDLIYAKTFTGGPANTAFVMKAVGEPDPGHSAPEWAYQFGGSGEGYTWRGDNQPPVGFSTDATGAFTAWVDLVTGRAGAGSTPPMRSPFVLQAGCPTAAQPSWVLYE